MSAQTAGRSPRIGSLFSGVGGLDLAVEAFFGGETVWHCEFDPEPSKVLAARWPGVPNLGDITTVDWATVEPVDILIGGFPCQDLSLAGRRRGMRPGTRSGLWADFKEAIRALNPSVVIVENVRGLLSGCAESDLEPCPGCVGDGDHRPVLRALGRVLGDLDALGFDAEWGGLRAADVGAPHGRFRVFVVAYRRGIRLGEGWDTVAREAPGGWAPTVTRGRADAPVGRLFSTPDTAPEAPNTGSNSHKAGNIVGLGNQVRSLLPTITASEAEKGGPNQAHGGGDRTLSGTVTLLPTPIVSDSHGAADRSTRPAYGGTPFSTQLREIAQLLPTTTAADAKASGGADGSSNVTLTDALVRGRVLPTPRASRGASATETMYALGAERDDTGDRQGNVVGEINWGVYEPAVSLWEHLTRPAPNPTSPDGKNGAHRLSSRFPEWMMGYLDGWVTDILTRNPAIKACGNGVVPQQAYAALGILWSRVIEAVAA